MEEERPKIKEEILVRVKWLYLFFFIAGLVFTGRIVYVMFFSEEIAVNAERLRDRIIQKWEVPAMRGSILSRDGEPLASSMFRYRVEMDFGSRGFDSLKTYSDNVDSLSKLLSAYFGDRSAAQYREFFTRRHNEHYRVINPRDTAVMRSESRFARFIDRMLDRDKIVRRIYDTLRDSTLVPVLPREIDYNEWKVLSTYPIFNYNMGMTFRLEKTDRRIYPQGELARRTIGRSDDRGHYGIEEVCRQALAGTNGQAERQRIARGFYGRVPGGNDIAPVDGLDVVTTIDLELQDVADKALRSQLEKQNAIWGTTIIMETRTGDILAMVNLGRSADGSYTENRNYALSGRMEPGSTFKLAALLALIEDAHKDLTLTYDSGNGRKVKVGNAMVQDSHSGFSEVDLKTATAQSLNVFYAKAIYEEYKDDPKRYTDFLSSLHLDRPMGLEAFGEMEPTFPVPGSKIWYRHTTLPNMGYGYGIELAPIQTITLYNAVANDGRMVAPRLIRELRRGDDVVERYQTKVLVDRICSPATLRAVRECLEEVTRSGTAKEYFRDTTRYRAAAKTGTAMVAQGGHGYGDGYRLGSMVTYLPADKPRYTIMTAVYTRRGYGTTVYGAGLAGPVQKRIADYIYNRDYSLHGAVSGDGSPHYPTSLKGGDISQIRRVAGSLSTGVSSDSRRGWGRVEVDSASAARITPLQTEFGRVPDVRGTGLKEAMFMLESAGLRVSFRGRGAVVSQSLAPGSECREGQKIEIVLK